MLREVLHKMAALTTIGLGTILVMSPIQYYVSQITKNLIGQLIIGIILIAIGISFVKNKQEEY